MPDPNPFPPNPILPAGRASVDTGAAAEVVAINPTSSLEPPAYFPITVFRAQFIRPREGHRLDVYADSLGIWTTGEGFNMEQPGAKEVCARYGIDWDACMAEKGTRKDIITEGQCTALFMHVLTALLLEIQAAIPSFPSLSANRQMAIMDVAWAGIGTFRKFVKMIAAINVEEWAEAAKELLDSHLAVQWGKRAQKDAQLLLEG